VRSIDTERLRLRELCVDDAPFMLELLNEPGWLRFIGDRGVRTLDGARDYLLNGPITMYRERGFGLYCVTLKDTGVPLGVCGLIKRDTLDDIDIGFAFLGQHEGRGHGVESATAVMQHARHVLGIVRIVAITSVDNHASMRLLEKIGLSFEKRVTLAGGSAEVCLFGTP
jgi:[ribosomal protein S5]-alanine N-acetyltransferase